jgi:hypothetical protein
MRITATYSQAREADELVKKKRKGLTSLPSIFFLPSLKSRRTLRSSVRSEIFHSAEFREGSPAPLLSLSLSLYYHLLLPLSALPLSSFLASSLASSASYIPISSEYAPSRTFRTVVRTGTSAASRESPLRNRERFPRAATLYMRMPDIRKRVSETE